MFEKATRKKLRFDAPQMLGFNVEDLWDLRLTDPTGNKANLDDIAKSLHKQLKEDDTESFVTKNTKAKGDLQLKFDIVIHIIKARQAEAEKAERIKANRNKRQMILGLMVQQENEELMKSSREQLQAILNSMEDEETEDQS